MSQPVGYAADWLEIATEIKQAAGYRFGGFMQITPRWALLASKYVSNPC